MSVQSGERPPHAHGRVTGERDQSDGAEQFSRAFKAAMAALRRMRGRESHLAGELSHAQYGLLFCLRDCEMSTGELADAADLSPASVTEMLDGLAYGGLVERSRSVRDRRVVLTSLTERGRTLVEQRRADFEPRFRAAFAGYSDHELMIAAAALDRLRALFDELAGERGAPANRR